MRITHSRTSTTRFASLVALLSVSLPTMANITLFENDKYTADMHGWIGVNYYDNDNADSAEITDGHSRIGFGFNHILQDGWTAIAKVEWGVSLVDRGTSLSVRGDGVAPQGSEDDIFWNRIGYIGATHEKWGTIQVGKQWGVYYDVVSGTDTYPQLGAYTAGAYNISDGGISGVGRSDGTISYRNSIDKFSFGIQYIPQDETIKRYDNDGNVIDESIAKVGNAYGLSASYQFTEKFKMGVGYNVMEINSTDSTPDSADGEDDMITALSATYGSFGGKGFYGSASTTVAENHEIDDVGNLIDTTSLEFQVGYGLDNDVMLYAGYELVEDDESSTNYQGEYELNSVYLGAWYFWTDGFSIYAETKIDDSTNFDGSDADDNIVLIGGRINL